MDLVYISQLLTSYSVFVPEIMKVDWQKTKLLH